VLFYGYNVTSNKTNIRSLHQIVELELSEYDEEKFVDTKEVTGSRNSRGRQPNGKKKKRPYNKQRYTKYYAEN
jgi:hypothetical protein